MPQASTSAEKPSLRVLLVEDSKLLADQISELLAGTACTTSLGVATTEQEAIAASTTQHPDLLILDLHLKQGTGFGVLKAVARLPKQPRVVVLTNYALPQYREQALALGAHHFLDKSADFDLLPELIQDISRQLNAKRPA
ncbi:MAG TPA: response regulator [Steroidobacteraceae bacterium]|nr:response regulator [Steroidobacteraceae bacterium]